MATRKKNPHAVALGRLGGLKGGRSRSPAKVAAVRENGKLGGRPRNTTTPPTTVEKKKGR